MKRTSVIKRWAGATGVAFLLGGCSLDSILKSDELPGDVTDPAVTRTPEGALAAYNGTLVEFRTAASAIPGVVGILGDELQTGRGIQSGLTALDRRVPWELDGSGRDAYSRLQRVRGQSTEAIGLLTRYAPGREALTGHLYAVQGYAEILLAELFCSGIPLSTLDFDGDFTLRPGSTTQEVLEHALQRFDSSEALAGDSVRFVRLAQMGRARALLALGRFAEAAAAAAQVENGYSYALNFSAAAGTNAFNFARIPSGQVWDYSVADREGLNGLDYRTSGDPRTRFTARGAAGGFPIYHPNKYAINGSSPIVLASGVEARLIEAEAALQTGGIWLEFLNALRTNGTFTTRPNATDPTRTDTLWTAGSGGMAGLRPLIDPGTPQSRVDLVFRERAFWLFLTGHRQGDLRRLIRQYGRAQEQIYPIGPYRGGSTYGSDVTLPVPSDEQVSNPHFTGCASRGA